MFQLSDIFWCIVPSRLAPLPLLVLRLFELLPSFMLDSLHPFSFYPVRNLFYHWQMQSVSISARLRTVISSPSPSFTQGSTCGRFSSVEEERPKSIQLQPDGNSIQWTTFFRTWTSTLFGNQGFSALQYVAPSPPLSGVFQRAGLLESTKPLWPPVSTSPSSTFPNKVPQLEKGYSRNQLSAALQEQNQPTLQNLVKTASGLRGTKNLRHHQ
jgi:hypothetical protein